MNEKNAGIPMRWRENESMLIDSVGVTMMSDKEKKR